MNNQPENNRFRKSYKKLSLQYIRPWLGIRPAGIRMCSFHLTNDETLVWRSGFFSGSSYKYKILCKVVADSATTNWKPSKPRNGSGRLISQLWMKLRLSNRTEKKTIWKCDVFSSQIQFKTWLCQVTGKLDYSCVKFQSLNIDKLSANVAHFIFSESDENRVLTFKKAKILILQTKKASG